MTNLYGYNNKDIHMLHDDGHEPTLNEQEVARLQRTKPHMPVVNAVVGAVLRSPLHGILSGSTMLLSITGRKTGRTFTTPVNYIEDEQGSLFVLSQRNRMWWHNLNQGAHVTMWLRGQERGGFAVTIRNPGAIASETVRLVASSPGLARVMHIRKNADDTLNAEDVMRVATEYIVISIHLN